MNYQNKKTIKTRLSVLFVLVLLVSLPFLSSCAILEDAVEIASIPEPTADDTYISIAELNRALEEAMKSGETSMTFNVANITEDELAHLAKNMSPFWGVPKSYTINREYEEMENIIPGQLANVKNITSSLELSDNYFVVKNLRDSQPIPEEETNALEIAAALPAISEEIFAGIADVPYDKILALHDWIVKNLNYDDTVEEIGPQNGSYGALINRQTMCQGYAESIQLILTCYTDIINEIAIGTAQAEPEAEWIGHAWNLVMIDGSYYHIDATFNDPKENSSPGISHYYFAQNDAVIQANHQWEADYFPKAEGESFLYFKKAGLFAPHREELERIVTEAVTDATPEIIEVAATDVQVDESSLQFIFQANDTIEEVLWTEVVFENIHLFSFEPKYSGSGEESEEGDEEDSQEAA